MVVTFFLFIYSSIIFLINYLNIFFKKYYVFYICIIFFIFINLNFFFQEQFLKFQNFKERNTRIEFNMIIKKINEIKLIESNFNQNSFLTFDNDFQIWLILNNIKYLNINNQLFSPKTDYMIEQDIINNFKFLGLNKKDFYNFFENKIERWRVINYNVADFFRAKYTANSLSTYNYSKNFDIDITEFIVKSSPIYSQQLALPKEEFIRLQKRFDGTLFNKNFNKPNFIILEKNHYVYQNIKKKVSKDFCVIFNGEFYIFYGNHSKKRFCIN